MSSAALNSGVVDPSFYADFDGLTALKKNVKANDPKAIRAAAQQFESLFTEMMLKSMREAKLGEGLGDSDQTDFYQDMYDQQLSLQISRGKGLGLADMLVQQLTRSGAIKGATTGSEARTGIGASTGTSSGTGAHALSGRTVTGTAPAIGRHAAGSSPAAAGGSSASHQQRIGFIQRLEPYAQRAAAQLGVSADSLIAQAALETGWGRHMPGGRAAAGAPGSLAAAGSGGSADGGDAAESSNLFGIKAGAGWRGAAVSATTTEYDRGVAVKVPQAFRAYASLRQGINDYVTLLQRAPGYQAALGTGENVTAFASALARAGYASDPDYVHKLVATAAAVKSLRAGTNAALVTDRRTAGAAGGAAAAGDPPAGAPLKLAELKLVAAWPIADGGITA